MSSTRFRAEVNVRVDCVYSERPDRDGRLGYCEHASRQGALVVRTLCLVAEPHA